ncbi:MAG TPA: hypothetical protein VG406_12705 [Isosphaeraceae bacterium]|jgi:hypothetical protein|nr:hypothetical protein [Isosphaeraceae bacterium]
MGAVARKEARGGRTGSGLRCQGCSHGREQAKFSRRRRVASGPGLEALEGRRLLAANASQVAFREVTSNGATALVITGTNRADVIAIADDGTAAAGNVTVALGDGTTYTSRAAISEVEVLGKGGDDQVSYRLTGDLNSYRAVLVDLGAGNDQFSANLGGAVANTDGLDLQVRGDSGNDNLAVNQSGATTAGTAFVYLEGDGGNDTITYHGNGAVASGAALVPGLSGGSGNDTITSDYSGQVDGNYIYNLASDGGAGNDVIADSIALAAGSTGTVGAAAGTPAAVLGGPGNDQVRFSVVIDPSATQAQVNALAVGGPGKDNVQRTANVQTDRSNEGDTVLS